MYDLLTHDLMLNFSWGVVYYFLGFNIKSVIIFWLAITILLIAISKNKSRAKINNKIFNCFVIFIGWILANILDNYGYKKQWYSRSGNPND